MRRVGLFGGSFNPPHVGHQMAMLYALATGRLDELLVVPCFRHAFDKPLVAFDHRLAMTRLAVEPFGGRAVVSDVEARIGGPSRTLHTVRSLLAERPGIRLVLVIGADLVAERERWYGWSELRALVDFAVVGRAGYDAAGLAIPDVSSSEVRRRLATGESVEGLVPSSVIDYVRAEELFRDPAPAAGESEAR